MKILIVQPILNKHHEEIINEIDAVTEYLLNKNYAVVDMYKYGIDEPNLLYSYIIALKEQEIDGVIFLRGWGNDLVSKVMYKLVSTSKTRRVIMYYEGDE